MEYKLYKLVFQGAVHFGKQDLDEGEYTCCADTIFSALCQEALKAGEGVLQELYHHVKDGDLLISDALPYMGDSYFVPKPVKRIDQGSHIGDPVIKKAFKRLRYIPVEMLGSYIQGDYDIMSAPDFGTFGHLEMKTAASIRGEKETAPYRIGTYYHAPGNGLYLIAGYKDQHALGTLEDLLERLSFSGLGGKRAAGLGRFGLLRDKMPSELHARLQRAGETYMSLSVSLPTDAELDNVMDGAGYLLCRRSGFVASETYAPEQMRKRDLYVFKAGSCFKVRFCGDIYDVSAKGGRHPVYRYAKPMLMEV